jgi:hypothetical protein
MPIMREFTIQMEDQPGSLGKFCQTLADRGVNILAFHSSSSEGKSTVRIVVDKLTMAKTALDTERYTYTETEVAQAKLPHQPGELARAASRLGEAGININYAYTGIEPGTNVCFVFFGVKEVAKAAPILEQAAAAAAKP